MKSTRTLFSLLPLATAVIGVASGQLTSSSPAPTDLSHRDSDVVNLAARFKVETERRVITVTKIQGSDASEEDQPVPTQNDRDGDEKEDDKEHDAQPTTEVPSSPTKPPTDKDHSPGNDDTLSTTTTRPPTNDSQNEQENNKGGLSAGAAAGITAVAIASAALIAAAAFFLWRRRQGGIRGAIITADYPRGLEDVPGQGPNPPVVSQPAESADGIYGVDGAKGYEAAESRYDPPPWPEEHDLGEGPESSVVAGSGGNRREIGQSGFRIPPAGTMPGDPMFDRPQDYPPQQSLQYQRDQQYQSGGDLGEARPVSDLTACSSPGTIMPVSPMTCYRPESSIFATPGQHQQSRSQVSSYYPHQGNPELPTFLVPGGNKERAMRFSSVAHVGGGPRVPQLVGSPPSQQQTASVMIVVEEHSPTGQSHVN
ncbi:hypothetical protein VTH82DRAFT_8598 [Thermothelomyces myriococcoides]